MKLTQGVKPNIILDGCKRIHNTTFGWIHLRERKYEAKKAEIALVSLV